MKKCLIIIISLLLFVGCTNTKNSDNQDILAKQYQIYADKLDNQESYQTDCKEFTIKLIVNSIDDKSSRYDIIIDSPQINMYHLQAIAKVEKDKNKSLPTLGILEENTFSLIPGVIDKENGIYKGINLSGITSKKKFNVLVYLTFYQDLKNKKKEERFIKLYGNALDKLLANYGIGTRKEVKNYIRKGFVEVNGEIIKKDDYKVDHETDEIIFDGELIQYRPYVYLMLNKPQGYVSATKDNVHPTVIELIEGYENYDLFPVGRLDIDTEGLLLITNDGDFSHKLLAPSREHSKLYFAEVAGVMNADDIKAFKDGLVLSTGYKCKPANLKIITTGDNCCKVQIEIFEGKFHQVKKMVEACGKKVTYLMRSKIRNLQLDRSLELGDFRELSEAELVDLMNDL